jgi:DNA-binding transcriptional MerR regulator
VPDPPTIPNRPMFKAAEVCEIAGVQPFVLRSWEAEFPNLGYARAPGSPRVYRRVDVERVVQIKELVFGEGLTLAGVRRRLEAEAPVPDPETPSVQELYGRETRDRLLEVKRGLEAVLALVSREARNGREMAAVRVRLAPPRKVKEPPRRKATARAARPPVRSASARKPLKKKRR